MFRREDRRRIAADSTANPLALIASDYRRHREDQGSLRALAAEGLLATSIYRLRHWAHCGDSVPLRPAWKVLLYLLNRLQKVVTGIAINHSAQIGPGLYLMHFGGIFISGKAVIGSDCLILQGVTIAPDVGQAPRIGDRVQVLAGALVIGSIDIGDDAKIAAGAVVVKDVSAGTTVAGNPARPIGQMERSPDQ